MNHQVESFLLRRPEFSDIQALYQQKNDPEIASMLGGFSTGYSITDLQRWVEYHSQRKDELLWVIAREDDDRCIGHIGLYQIDHRIRSAEFAIMIGDRSEWGKGVGRTLTKFVLNYGFDELNLNRIHLTALSTNERALRLYRSLGFKHEGTMRQAQYKGGKYIDVIAMGLLREEYGLNECN
jgi:RimJ/RimL family protein N-acetyltransferase